MKHISLTNEQKLQAFANKYYLGGVEWEPKSGDYYTSTRADLELYQVVEVTEDKIKTRYCNPQGGDSISEWDRSTFLTEGFGINRMHVPEWIFTLLQAFKKEEISNSDCTCSKQADGQPLIGGYAGCSVHDPNYQKYNLLT